jgi:hypothetical protein
VKNTDSGPSDRQNLKSGEYPEVEDVLYTWFLQEHNRHTSISGGIIQETAKYFYKMIMRKDDFRASDGWLDKFKKQFRIRFVTIMGKKLLCDVSAVDPFVRKFREKIDEQHDDAMSAFNMCYKWAEDNNVQAEDILTLKRLQEIVLNEAFRNKIQKTIEAFFLVKTQ